MATHLCLEHVKDDCYGKGSCETQAEHPGGTLQRGWSFSKPVYANPEGLDFQMVRTAALRDDGPHGGPEPGNMTRGCTVAHPHPELGFWHPACHPFKRGGGDGGEEGEHLKNNFTLQ